MKNYVQLIKNYPFNWLYEAKEAAGNNKYICDSYKILDYKNLENSFCLTTMK